MRLTLFASFLLALGCCRHTEARQDVPGPGFPPLKEIKPAAVVALQEKLNTVIEDISKEGKQNGNSNFESSSFALQVTSAIGTLWSAYHTGAKIGNGTTHVGGDTVFRIASISKTFTVYALLLQESIHLDDVVTKFLPELMDREERDGLVSWDRITVRSLASQLSGIPRDTGGPCFIYRDIIDMKEILDPVNMGLPPVPWQESQRQMTCQLSDILEIAKRADQVYVANHLSTYSNMAFSLLGAILERASGETYEGLLKSTIWEPLHLDHTSASRPLESTAAIPEMTNDFYTNLGADVSTAGLYSSPNDMSKYMRSILSTSLLPPHVVEDWMQPHSWSNRGSTSAYGMPWEILRTTRLTGDERPLDIVTKGGALKAYYSTIAMIPELGIGFSVLVAGNQQTMFVLRDRVTSALVPSIDNTVREAARRTYDGDYALTVDGRVDTDWRLSLEVEEGRPGLHIVEWVSNGTNFLDIYGHLQGVRSSMWEARLLPSGVQMKDNTVEIWRIEITQDRDEGDEAEESVWGDASWTDIDDLQWADKSIGEFRITKGDDGYATKIQMIGLRIELSRIEMPLFLMTSLTSYP